jgi:hypothetical protein
MVIIFAEPDLEDPAPLVPCSQIEGNCLRLGAFTFPLDEDVALAEMDGVGSQGKTEGISEGATVG